MTCEPHARQLQQVASGGTIPREAISFATKSVDATTCALVVPKSASVARCAVKAGTKIVVTIIRCKHHVVLVAECVVANVARITRYLQPVVVCFILHSERRVLSIIPRASILLQIEPQSVAAFLCQLMQLIIAKPVVASAVVESDFKLGPRTIEEVRSINVLLNQQRDTVGYRTNVYVKS